ncbi:MAG: protein kinase [Acidobacteria bacterium]|nr:protein kinase [Acidobacteriota bacterium]
MQSAEWLKIKELFYRAIELAPADRARFLAALKDAALRSEVAALVASHEQAADFIAEPVPVGLGLDQQSLAGREIGGYRLAEIVGTGGMGTVFRAESPDREKPVAFKIVKRGMDTDAVLRRFALERRILARLEHPSIARFLDGGTTPDGRPFFVMEYVEGVTLTRFCEERRLGVRARLELFLEICAAVEYAHRNLVVHRDLKPSNLLVTADGTPKLLDFGIARLLDRDGGEGTATATRNRMLTPEYAAPEQLNGLPVTTSADIYSLGVVLYELLSGRRPFQTKSRTYDEIARAVRTEEPPRPSSVVSAPAPIFDQNAANSDRRTANQTPPTNPKSEIRNPKSLRGDLDNIILKALRKEPERRYRTVTEFAADIRRYLKGLPVGATADGVFYRFSKFVRRHRLGTFAALVVALAAGVAVWQAAAAYRARARAESRARQMRDVAGSLLDETSRNLSALPDGLEIRQAVIEKSAAVLDSLADDTDDAEFLGELGAAYQQLGWARTWHLRDYEKAFENLQKARRLHERAVALAPGDARLIRRLVLTHGTLLEFYQLQGNKEATIELYRTNGRLNRRLNELEPDNPRTFFENSNNYLDLGEVLGGLGRTAESAAALDESLASIERAVDLQRARPASPDGESETAFFLMQKGALLEKFDRPDEALAVYGEAADLADRAYAADPAQALAFNHSVRVRRMMADVYRARGDWAKTLGLYEFCLARLEQNRDNKNLDQKSFFYAIPVYTMRVGIALDKLGRRAAGRERLETGLARYLENLKKFENFAADLLQIPEFLGPAADFFAARGEKRRAAELWRKEALERLENSLRKSPDDGALLNCLADALTRRADLLSGFEPAAGGFSETGGAFLKEALGDYEKALEYRRRAAAAGNSFAGSASEQLERKIARLRDRPAGGI